MICIGLGLCSSRDIDNNVKSDGDEGLLCDEGLTPTKDGGTCLRRLSMFRKEVH